MNEVDCKVIGTVLNFELVEENSQHLRGGHAAVDAHVCNGAVGRSEHGSLRKQNANQAFVLHYTFILIWI